MIKSLTLFKNYMSSQAEYPTFQETIKLDLNWVLATWDACKLKI